MPRRTALDIKKKILALLKEQDMTPRELESKINTNNKTIITQLNELEFLGFIRINKHEKNESNGRPFTTIKLVKAH